MCLKSLYQLKKTSKSQLSREGGKATSSQLQAGEVPPSRVAWRSRAKASTRSPQPPGQVRAGGAAT